MKRRFFGKTIINIKQPYTSLTMDTVVKYSLEYEKISNKDDGSIDITVFSNLRDNYAVAFKNEGIDAEFSLNKGLIPYFFRYSRRFGLLIGVAFLILTVHLSSNTVWKINIEGNKELTYEEIIFELKNNGFCKGSYIPKIDFDSLHNRILLNSKEIAWISVNMDGNIANVKIREISNEESEKENYFSNVVAKYDGQIAFIKKYNGIRTVKVLDTVKKGDILISGIIDSKSQGVRYVHAEGEVEAYVRKMISVKIPYNSTEKIYSGNKTRDISLEFFSKNINILKNSGNLYNLYDTIETYEDIILFGIIHLPIRIKKTVYSEYELKEVTYTEKEVREKAMSKLRYETDAALANAELISKKITHFNDFEFYYLECELYCYEDIAKIVKFEVKGN